MAVTVAVFFLTVLILFFKHFHVLFHFLVFSKNNLKNIFKINEDFFRKIFLFVLIVVGFLIINKAVIYREGVGKGPY